jgi:alanine dehydrogenase
MREAMMDFSSKNIHHPSRSVLQLTDKNALGYMPCYVKETQTFGAKLTSIFHDNNKQHIDPHQGIVILFDVAHGQPLAILNASEITARRTAATSAAATDILAQKNAKKLAVFGYGVQAKEHIEAIRTVREISQINIFTRSIIRSEYSNKETHFYNDISATIAGAEIICLCTSATIPFLSSKEICPGTHINAIGACRPGRMEISIDSEVDLSIYVDSRDSAALEASEINPTNSKMVKGEIGEVIAEQITGRTERDQITIFKSIGLAIQDVYAAKLAVVEAKKMGLGKEISF